FNGLLYRSVTCRYTNNVSIVMLARQRRNFFNPAKCSPNFLVFVNTHGNTVTATTYNNTKIGSTVFNIIGNRVYKIRIVYTVKSVCTMVNNFYTLLFQVLY